MILALAMACAPVVTDGDSWRACGERYRLVAASGPVDAPETEYRPGRWNDKLLAAKAKARLSQLLPRGSVSCNGRDRYQRNLCRVTVNGRDVGDILVAEGLAVVRNDWR